MTSKLTSALCSACVLPGGHGDTGGPPLQATGPQGPHGHCDDSTGGHYK